jgi:hypothetical protein
MSETKEPLDNSQEKVVALINSFCGQAMEYCDAVQIFCTMKSDNGKFHRFHEYGRVNWFARFGAVVAWEREQRLSDPGESE